MPSVAVLGATVIIGSALYAAAAGLRPADAGSAAGRHRRRQTGSLVASFAILFFPVTFLGMYSPFAIRLLLRSAAAFRHGVGHGLRHLHPRQHRRHARHHLLPDPADGLARASPYARASARHRCGLVLIALPRLSRRAPRLLRRGRARCMLAACSATQRAPRTWSTSSCAPRCSSAPDGQIAHIETEYNDIFITKRRHELTMSFQLKGWDYTEFGHQPARSRRPAAALHPLHDARRWSIRRSQAHPDDRARRRLDLDLSRPRHAGGRRSTPSRSIPASSTPRRNISASARARG